MFFEVSGKNLWVLIVYKLLRPGCEFYKYSVTMDSVALKIAYRSHPPDNALNTKNVCTNFPPRYLMVLFKTCRVMHTKIVRCMNW